MTKKLSYDEVKNYVNSRDCDLLTEEKNYVSTKKTKLHIWCRNENHPSFFIDWSNFRKGSGCKYCSWEKISSERKMSQEYVEKYVEETGNKLLSIYKNKRTKMKIECPEGHIFEVYWSNFKRGTRCPICFYNNKRHSYNFIKEEIEKEGYSLVSKEYNNCEEKLHLICPSGHDYYVSFHDWKGGSRCYECFGNKPNDKECIKSYIKSFEYRMVTEYEGSNKIILLECDKGHKFQTTWKKFKRGRRCPICQLNFKKTYKEVKEYIENQGYQLLSEEYKNSWTKLILKCPKGHEYEVRYNDFKNGVRCPFCWQSSSTSKLEEKIRNFVKYIYNGEILPNDKKTIINPNTGRNLELDVYMPEIAGAIEVNGKYWHSKEFPEKIKLDQIKKEECEKLGINLMIINEEDFINNKKEVFKKTRNFILGE